MDVTFTDASSDSDGSIMAWSWDFGDGNSAAVQNPSHTYVAGGTYTVALTVTDNESGIDASSQQLAVSAGGGGNAPPVANFAYACSARNCTFDSSASTDDVGIVSYTWTFGDGSSSSLANPSHTYPANGNFGVTLVVTDVELASDSVVAIFRVKNRGNTSGSTGGDSGGDSGDSGGTTGGSEKGRKKCNDGIDNDGDGLIDEADSDCQ